MIGILPAMVRTRNFLWFLSQLLAFKGFNLQDEKLDKRLILLLTKYKINLLDTRNPVLACLVDINSRFMVSSISGSFPKITAVEPRDPMKRCQQLYGLSTVFLGFLVKLLGLKELPRDYSCRETNRLSILLLVLQAVRNFMSSEDLDRKPARIMNTRQRSPEHGRGNR